MTTNEMITTSRGNSAVLKINGPKEISYTILSFTLPTLTTSAVYTPYRNNIIKNPGDSIEISQVTIEFQLMENMNNYFHFIDWIKDNMENRDNKKNIDILIYDNNSDVIKTISLIDTFPISVTGLSYSNIDVTDLSFTVDFETDDIKYD